MTKRIKYGDKTIDMPDAMTLEQAKEQMARFFPELAEPAVETKKDGDNTIYVFSKKAGRKGAYQTTNTNGAITAFPLAWPAGWKRTAARDRRRATFGNLSRNATTTWRNKKELSVAAAMDRVLDELRALGVSRDAAIISTNLDVRLDGLPRSGQREPDDPGAAVYWTRRGDRQRCMAIDQYNRVADNLAAIASTLEAMRRIERHGGAEILDRAFTGFAALPAPTSANWRSVLGVGSASSADAVRDAYGALAKKLHPDYGGDAEAFLVIQKAWDEARQELGL